MRASPAKYNLAIPAPADYKSAIPSTAKYNLVIPIFAGNASSITQTTYAA